MTVKVKRIYEPIGVDDGFRILVDRLWPRGVKKESSGIDLWLKDIAPSTELRKWFKHHHPEQFEEFSAKYKQELEQNPCLSQLFKLKEEKGTITLLYASKSEHQNHATLLKDMLQ